MSGPSDKSVTAEAAGRLAQDVIEFMGRHDEAERERIISEVMVRLDSKKKEPLDPQWAVQKWIELHAAFRFQLKMRKLVTRGTSAAHQNAGMHPDIG